MKDVSGKTANEILARLADWLVEDGLIKKPSKRKTQNDEVKAAVSHTAMVRLFCVLTGAQLHRGKSQ